MIDVVALGEVLIDFASRGTNANGYPLMQALPGGAPANFLTALTKYGKSAASLSTETPGGIPSIPEKDAVLQAM